jgi:hypothetical protein
VKYEVEHKRAKDKRLAQELTELLNDGELEQFAKGLNDQPTRVVNCIKEMAQPCDFRIREISDEVCQVMISDQYGKLKREHRYNRWLERLHLEAQQEAQHERLLEYGRKLYADARRDQALKRDASSPRS